VGRWNPSSRSPIPKISKAEELPRTIPPQYFAALPNFIGLQMVWFQKFPGSQELLSLLHEDERGQYLGSVTIGDQKIDLSPRLNTIIGGRGSGKSVLLDRLAMALDDSKCEKHFNDTDRIEFLKASTPTVQCLSGQTVIHDSFQFEYFNQSYVSLPVPKVRVMRLTGSLKATSGRRLIW